DPDDENVRQRLVQTRATVRQGGATVPSTLREERLTNPFLKCGTNAKEFARIRSLKDRW
ncbi:MAG: hydroxyacylglutathione hydrolase, partial [Lentisphaerae bacterium]|nr:hydroxyacylglutathione hydrolase [Lentisphaerota bacterium]